MLLRCGCSVRSFSVDNMFNIAASSVAKFVTVCVLYLYVLRCAAIVPEIEEIFLTYGNDTFIVYPDNDMEPFANGIVSMFMSATDFTTTEDLQGNCTGVESTLCKFTYHVPAADDTDSVAFVPIYTSTTLVAFSEQNPGPAIDQITVKAAVTCLDGYYCFEITAHAFSIAYERCNASSLYADLMPCAFYGSFCAPEFSPPYCNIDAVPTMEVRFADILTQKGEEIDVAEDCSAKTHTIQTTPISNGIAIQYAIADLLSLPSLQDSIDAAFLTFNIFVSTPMYNDEMHVINAHISVNLNITTGEPYFLAPVVQFPPWNKGTRLQNIASFGSLTNIYHFSGSVLGAKTYPPFDDTSSDKASLVTSDFRQYISGSTNQSCVYSNPYLKADDACFLLFYDLYNIAPLTVNGVVDYEFSVTANDFGLFYQTKGDLYPSHCYIQMAQLSASALNAYAVTLYNATIMRPQAAGCIAYDDVFISGLYNCDPFTCIANYESTTNFIGHMLVGSNGNITTGGVKIMLQSTWKHLSSDDFTTCEEAHQENEDMKTLVSSLYATRNNGSEQFPFPQYDTTLEWCTINAYEMYSDPSYYSPYDCVRPSIGYTCNYCNLTTYYMDAESFDYAFPSCDFRPCQPSIRHDLHIYSVNVTAICDAANNGTLDWNAPIELVITYNASYTSAFTFGGVHNMSGAPPMTPQHLIKTISVFLDASPCSLNCSMCMMRRDVYTPNHIYKENVATKLRTRSNDTQVNVFNATDAIIFVPGTVPMGSPPPNFDIYAQPFYHILGSVVMSGISIDNLNEWLDAPPEDVAGLIVGVYPNITEPHVDQLLTVIGNLRALGTTQSTTTKTTTKTTTPTTTTKTTTTTPTTTTPTTTATTTTATTTTATTMTPTTTATTTTAGTGTTTATTTTLTTTATTTTAGTGTTTATTTTPTTTTPTTTATTTTAGTGTTTKTTTTPTTTATTTTAGTGTTTATTTTATTTATTTTAGTGTTTATTTTPTTTAANTTTGTTTATLPETGTTTEGTTTRSTLSPEEAAMKTQQVTSIVLISVSGTLILGTMAIMALFKVQSSFMQAVVQAVSSPGSFFSGKKFIYNNYEYSPVVNENTGSVAFPPVKGHQPFDPNAYYIPMSVQR